MLGAPGEGRASLLVAVTPGAIERGVKAGAIVKVAAAAVGGGGGGRDNMAQAGGKDPDKLPDALAAARAEIERALARLRVVALDYGSARCGVAVSDPTGTLATPREPVLRPGDQERVRGAEARDRRRWRPSGSSSGCRSRSPGSDSAQTIETREFAERLAARGRRAGRALRRALHDVAGAAGGRAARRWTRVRPRPYWTNGCTCRLEEENPPLP